MRVIVSLLLVLVFASSSFAAISAKAGLAGGALRISGVMDRQVKDKMSVASEIGYGIGNQYNVLTAGVSGIYDIKPDIYAGLNICYSVYSSPVTLGLPSTNITEKSGVGGGVFAGMRRDKMFAQIGYDTRLGALAEAGYVVRM